MTHKAYYNDILEKLHMKSFAKWYSYYRANAIAFDYTGV